MYTRQEYLNASKEEQNTAHRKYYGQFVNALYRDMIADYIGKANLLASKDDYFNDIALVIWDNAPRLSWSKRLANEELGDRCFGSVCDYVCIAKEAARQWVELNVTKETNDASKNQI